MPSLLSRIRQTHYVTAPMVVAGATFVAWALISHLDAGESSSVIISGFSIGMTIYLPLSLGLPFILANYFRTNSTRMLMQRHFILSTLSLVGFASLLCGLIFTLWGLSHASALSTALVLAGCVILGSTVQQLGRIADSLPQFFLGLCCTLILPTSWLIWLFIGDVLGDTDQRYNGLVIQLSLLIYGTALLTFIGRSLPIKWLFNYRNFLDLRIIRSSLPMIPHLLFFALLMQGVRMSASWAGSAAAINAGHQVMLVLNVGALVVTSVHGVFSVKIMTLDDLKFGRAVRAFAYKYATLGIISSCVVIVVFTSPIRMALNGLPELSLLIMGLVTLIPPSLAGYYFMSAIFLRHHKTKTLFFISASTVVLWFITYLILPGHDLNMLIVHYSLICPCLFIFSFLALLRARLLRGLDTILIFAVFFVSFMPWVFLIMISI